MPEWSDDLRARLRGLRLSASREAEIVEELAQHLDQRYEELRSEGASDRDARRLAIEELREPGALAHEMSPLSQARLAPPLTLGAPGRFRFGELWQDLRYAVRLLRKERGFAAAAILTLGLGIGVNGAVFALVDATLLRPLPFPDPERLVMLRETTATTRQARVSPANLVDWNERSATFEAIGGYLPDVGGMVMRGADGRAETVPRQWATAGIFDALGVRPVVGRTFVAADDTGRASVVVLSEAFWRTRFNADPNVVGRDLRLDGSPYTVVGVVPDEAQLIGRTSIWALIPIQGAPPAARSAYILHAIGRVKPGATLDAALADMTAVAQGLARDFPTTNHGRGVALQPLHETVIGSDLRQTSTLFLGVVGFVLLMCCANVANLLLTRATVRKRELAIRSALGADRPRVVRQLVTESLLMAVIGAVMGLGLGAIILHVAPSVIPADLLPPAVALTFNARVVAFCAATALFIGLLFGLAPAWQATAFSVPQAIASDSRTATARGGRARTLLAVGQVATAVLLLVGAGLLLRTLLNVERVDYGYKADSVLTMIVDPLAERYPTADALRRFYEEVEQEVRALPGVRSVAWASTLPSGRTDAGRSSFEVVGSPATEESTRPTADYQIVSPPYFRTLDLPVLAGRPFDDRDTPDGVPVCIVSEAFVRAFVRNRSPLGLQVALRPAGSPEAPPAVREIVGVARQVKGRPDEIESLVQIYVPLAQDTTDDIFMLVRPASVEAEALAPSVREAIARVDREQLVSVRSIMTLHDVARDATARHRFRAVLVTAFAALAVLLAMVGLFGVLAYSVQQRLRDFGVRRALGASTADVCRLIGASAARVVAAGGAIGLAASAALGPLLATMLSGVEPLDPITFAVVTFVLLLTAAIAAAGPAWRATRVDPAVALRGE